MTGDEIQDGVPSRRLAESYLDEAQGLNPGPWIDHSRQAALGARLIAEQHPTLDPQRAYVLALLHDIGRRYGVCKERHALLGYRFLMEQGFAAAAQVCLTHSFFSPRPVDSGLWDGITEEADFVRQVMAGMEIDDYDRLVQLCDSISLPGGFCLMEKRFVDVTMRYGADEFTLAEWRHYYEVKAHLEQATGGSIYCLLPGVVERTFDW